MSPEEIGRSSTGERASLFLRWSTSLSISSAITLIVFVSGFFSGVSFGEAGGVEKEMVFSVAREGAIAIFSICFAAAGVATGFCVISLGKSLAWAGGSSAENFDFLSSASSSFKPILISLLPLDFRKRVVFLLVMPLWLYIRLRWRFASLQSYHFAYFLRGSWLAFSRT